MKHLKEFWFMFLLTTLCTVVLVISEGIYQKQMAADPIIARRTAQLLPAMVPILAGEDAKTVFEKAFDKVTLPGISGQTFIGRQKPQIMVRQEEGAGLWGKVTILVGYDAEKDMVLGIEILEHSETPGLGARIEEEGFRSQFRNLFAGNGVKSAKIKFREGEFDGVSGATMSSLAVEEIVNSAIRSMRQVRVSRQGQAK